MKRFRSLVIATAAICSFQSSAGVISFNWNPNDHSEFQYSMLEGSNDAQWNSEYLASTFNPVSIPAKFEIGSSWEDTGILPVGEGSQRWFSTYSTYNFLDPFKNSAEFCSYTQFAKVDCIASSSNNFYYRTDISMVHQPGGYSYLNMSLSAYFELERTSINQGDITVSKFRSYSVDLSISKNFFGTAPLWLQNLEMPSHADIVNFLKSDSYKYTTLKERLVMNNSTCQDRDCHFNYQNYWRNLQGSYQVTSETVPLPTTASFLLLGLAGLALRRRLTA